MKFQFAIVAISALLGLGSLAAFGQPNRLSNGSLNTWTTEGPSGWSTTGSASASTWSASRTLELDATGAILLKGSGASESDSHGILSQEFTPFATSTGFCLSFDLVVHATPGLNVGSSQPLTVQIYRADAPTLPWISFSFSSATPAKGPFSIELAQSCAQPVAPAAFIAETPYHLIFVQDGKNYSFSFYKLSDPTSVTSINGLTSYFPAPTDGGLFKVAFIGRNNGATIDQISLTDAPKESPSIAAVVITNQSVLDGPFQGFGAQWDPYQDGRNQVTDAEFALVKQRLAWMRMPITRMMMLAKWCYTDAGTYNFETPAMKTLYRQLDVCQELGMTVALTEWGYNDTWMKTPLITGISDPLYAKITATYLDHLVNVKGYTCIKHLIYINEGSWFNRSEKSAWLAGLSNFAAALKSNGLDQKVRLATTDASVHTLASLDNISWLSDVVPLSASIGTYELHSYITIDDMRKNDLRRIFTKAWGQVRASDPSTDTPLLITEGGSRVKNPPSSTVSSAGTNTLNADWRYGLYMAEYAYQAIDSGTWGVIAWMLDDNSHYGFNWGLWSDRHTGMKLKPWAYVWQLFSRMFPAGSTFVRTESDNPRVQVLAARHPANPSQPGEHWSFCLINKGSQPATATLALPGQGTLAAVRYLYSETSATKDPEGLPLPLDNLTLNLGQSIEVPCPPESVTFIVPASLVQ